MNYAVIGAGFGDEGKGMAVSSLCSSEQVDLVIRFSGGHQAAHQVVLPHGESHVFSNFGSGTLHGVPTFWSKHCTIDPVGIMNELYSLLEYSPTLYISKDCPVTTPFEKQCNQTLDPITKHGSCGVGFGATWEREERFHSITAFDLMFPEVLEIKLGLLARDLYCYSPETMPEVLETSMHNFLSCVQEFRRADGIYVVEGLPPIKGTHIYEGSQGLLLDQKHGFFPHVTRSNTDLTNITDKDGLKVMLVTRAYQTRHGNGPMTNVGTHRHIKPNPYEQNFDTSFQGEFRKSALDVDLLKYAMGRAKISKDNTTLVVTCLDLLEEYIFTADNGTVYTFSTEDQFLGALAGRLQLKEVLVSTNPYPGLQRRS